MNIKAPLNGLLGYGHAGINIVKALSNLKQSISLHPIGGVQLTTNDDSLFQQLLNSRFNNFDVDQPSLSIWHEYALFDRLQSNCCAAAFSFFEIDSFCEVRKKSVSCVDKFLVTSQWGKDVVVNCGVKTPVEIVPLGVDCSIFFPKMNTTDEKSPYKFFTIGKIEYRKCTHMLADIFSAAFSESDNVEFHIMCDSPLPAIRQQMSELTRAAKVSKLGDKIQFHSLLDTDQKLAEFIQDKDCGLFLTRAEGWGLPILQTLACGKEVITTNYSAHTEFCSEQNAKLIEIDELVPAIDNLWFTNPKFNWAAINNSQIDQCIEYMRNAYSTGKAENLMGVETAKKFTWENTAKVLLSALS